METFCPPVRQEDEGKDIDCFLPVSCCPACNQEYDVALILPCSHIMCGHCIVAGERTSSDQSLLRSVGLSVCSVLCPCCRHPVELPCWTWSSATSCLPKHPTLSPVHVSRERGTKKGASEDHHQHVQVRNTNLTKVSAHCIQYCNTRLWMFVSRFWYQFHNYYIPATGNFFSI